MKRLFLMAVALISLTTVFAKKESAGAFDMSMNLRQLSCCLGLTLEQMSDVENVHANFMDAMNLAAKTNDAEKALVVREAVDGNFKMMKGILNEKQYGRYALLMSTTFHNRGIDTYLN